MPSTDEDEDHAMEDDPKHRQTAMDNLVPPLDASEYGKMPSTYYRNSQQTAPAEKPHEDKPEEPQEVKAARPLIFPRDKFDGVDSDDETDSDEERLNEVGNRDGENSESEDERPQVVGEVEIDMAEEQEEFLRFSREALGITPQMWEGIVKDRNDRGGRLIGAE
jgi:hypothetical protein